MTVNALTRADSISDGGESGCYVSHEARDCRESLRGPITHWGQAKQPPRIAAQRVAGVEVVQFPGGGKVVHELVGGVETWIGVRYGRRSVAYATRAQAEQWVREANG